jgi:hypothetical protein
MTNDGYGAALAASGAVLAVGAPREGATGAVYVYQRGATGEWAQVAHDTGNGGNFGAAVAVDAAHVYVGAPDEITATGRGAVYIYDLDDLTATPARLASTTAGERFGASLAARDPLLVVGAPAESSTYPEQGAVHVFENQLAVATLHASNLGAGDRFGAAVATDGALIVVGAPLEGSAAGGIDPAPAGSQPSSGAVYVFGKPAATWIQRHVVKPPSVAMGDNFGNSVALLGNVLAIAAPYADVVVNGDTRIDAGKLFTYRLANGDLVAAEPNVAQAKNPGANDAFGTSIGLTLESLVVGAPFEDSAATGWNGNGGDGAVDTGAVYTLR